MTKTDFSEPQGDLCPTEADSGRDWVLPHRFFQSSLHSWERAREKGRSFYRCYPFPTAFLYCPSIPSIAFFSSAVNTILPAGAVSSTCEGLLAPTIADVTSGRRNTQAMAICAGVALRFFASAVSFSTSSRLALNRGSLKLMSLRRWSSAGNPWMRSRVNLPVNKPFCIGL